MLKQGFEWDTCQFPVNVLDFHYRSFEHDLLPELNRRGIAYAVDAVGDLAPAARSQVVIRVHRLNNAVTSINS